MTLGEGCGGCWLCIMQMGGACCLHALRAPPITRPAPHHPPTHTHPHLPTTGLIGLLEQRVVEMQLGKAEECRARLAARLEPLGQSVKCGLNAMEGDVSPCLLTFDGLDKLDVPALGVVATLLRTCFGGATKSARQVATGKPEVDVQRLVLLCGGALSPTSRCVYGVSNLLAPFQTVLHPQHTALPCTPYRLASPRLVPSIRASLQVCVGDVVVGLWRDVCVFLSGPPVCWRRVLLCFCMPRSWTNSNLRATRDWGRGARLIHPSLFLLK